MRIGTWNLEGRWTSDHLALLRDQACDVWLLTEVPTQASIPGLTAHRTTQAMGPDKTWAGVFSGVDYDSHNRTHTGPPRWCSAATFA